MKQLHRKYTAEEAAFLATNRLGHTEKELLELFNARFTPPLRLAQVEGYCTNHKLLSGLDRRFGHGQTMYVPPKGTHGSPATEFKKGHVPADHRPVGSEGLREDGYVWVKIAEPNVWRQKHVVQWEALHGPRPLKHAVIFADGNKQNFHPDNLLLVSRQELAVMNKRRLIGGSRELTETGKLIAGIKMKTAERLRKQKAKVLPQR